MTNPRIHRIGFDAATNSERISVYLRRLATKNVYYARYSIAQRTLANGQRFITESLRTSNLDEALERARQRFAEIKHKEGARQALKPTNVASAIKKFLSHYEGNVKAGVSGFSQPMLRGYRKTIGNYFVPYIGDKSVGSVTVNDLQEYERWRKEYAADETRERHGNSKNDVSPRTLEWEINAFKAFLRWCSQNGLYTGKAYEWVYKGGVSNKRSALTLEQYRKLYRYMQTNAYMTVGKHGDDSRIQRHRAMMRCWILFLVNTGLRVGEARYLCWHDISTRFNSKEQEVLAINVAAGESKVRKSRTVIGRHTALQALNRYKEYLKARGETVPQNAYIFADDAGQPFQELREGFKAIMKEAGVPTDNRGEEFVPYSLRHTYATFRIMYGKNVSIYKLAQNMGTSVAMIEAYYSDAKPQDFVDDLT